MAIICRKHKLLFIMVPATGCSVVGGVLQQHLNGEWLPALEDLPGGKMSGRHKHNTLPQILNEGLLTSQERDGYLTCATIRNPFSRWVTYYQRYAGDWIEEYFAFKRRQLERERQGHEVSERAYERRLRHIRREQHSKQRRARIIRALGFNTWMKATLLRWYFGGKGGSGRSPLEPYAFPMLDGIDVVIRQEQLEEGLNRVLRVAGIQEWISLPRKNATPGKKPYAEYYSSSTRRLAEHLLGDIPSQFGYQFEGVLGDEPVMWLSNDRRVLSPTPSVDHV